MKFSEAIQTKDINGLKGVMERASALYNTSAKEEPIIETVYGSLPFSAVLDIDTRWQLVAVAYAEIMTAAGYIDETADRKVEVAKLISNNPTLRAMTQETTNEVDELI